MTDPAEDPTGAEPHRSRVVDGSVGQVRATALWIGGSPGAGKSTIGRALAIERDLPLHPVDLWAYDHAARLPATRSLDDDLAAGADRAADAFEASSQDRLGLVATDLAERGIGASSAVVEGPQLLPRFAVAMPPGRAVWLVPDAEQTRRAREIRLARLDDRAGRARLEGLLARDAVLAQRVRDEAPRAALVEVPADPDWDEIGSAVRHVLAAGLAAARPLIGAELGRQRRIENLAACRQGRSWQAAEGFDRLPPYPFACECGRSGCTRTWPATPDDYDARRRSGWLSLH